MLPTRAYLDVPRFSPNASGARVRPEVHEAIVIAAAADTIEQFPSAQLTRYAAYTTKEAVRLIETARPRIVVIDWDVPEIDGAAVCVAALKFPQTAVLVTLASPERAPAALKAGCHSILLKPFAPNLVAGRCGRLSRELPAAPAVRGASHQSGTHRSWPATNCPRCQEPSAISFEFHSYRRMWYACLACDAVWLGARQE